LDFVDENNNPLPFSENEQIYWKAIIYCQLRNLVSKPETHLYPDDPTKEDRTFIDQALKRQRIISELEQAGERKGFLRRQTVASGQTRRGFTNEARNAALKIRFLRPTEEFTDLAALNETLALTTELGQITYVHHLVQRPLTSTKAKKRKQARLFSKYEDDIVYRILLQDPYFEISQ